jgi:hypothetical protein
LEMVNATRFYFYICLLHIIQFCTTLFRLEFAGWVWARCRLEAFACSGAELMSLCSG